MAPRATYRLQFGPELGFAAAAGLAPYLARLGISHVYLSPHLQAAPGSAHGYDVVDHSRVSEDLGGPIQHREMLQTFASAGLSVVIDLVPNHMSVARAAANVWWWDVLEHGQESRWAGYFDVDWTHPDERLRNRVLLPVLGDHYGRVLASGAITLTRESGRIVVRVNDQTYPLSRAASDLVGDDLEAVNADRERLHAVLELNNYRLAYWRSARFDLDYRRFFDINELVGLRVDDPEVFDATHALPLGWVREGLVSGLRVDHPDGLLDPRAYCGRLRAEAPDSWIVVEKILAHGEELPRDWPVQGTTGYDFAARVSGLWIDGSSAEAFSRIYKEITLANDPGFAPVAIAKKRRIIRDVLAADVRRVTSLFMAVCERHLDYRDTTYDEMQRALENVLAMFPVYRAYVRPGELASPTDREVIAGSIARARVTFADGDGRLFELIEGVLTGVLLGDVESAAMQRFQQISGPIAAKGVEDTAFFDHHRFIALNDVGFDPDYFGETVAEFHAYNTMKERTWPEGMVASSTHDTKRSEDVRARLAVLTEIPQEWRATVQRLRGIAGRYRGHEVDAGIEYHIYQTIVGAWPIDGQRLTTYLRKAMREAKDRTSWLRVNEAYEEAVQRFARQALGDPDFVRELNRLMSRIARAGEENALAQKLITLTAPGVPDIYQGTELWSYDLTDPDNRRPVDYARRAELTATAELANLTRVLAEWQSGLPKLWVTRMALMVRREYPACFDVRGGYTPLCGHDPRLIVFRRGERVITAASRLRLRPHTAHLTLPAGDWLNIFTKQRHHGRVDWDHVRGGLPCALLVAG